MIIKDNEPLPIRRVLKLANLPKIRNARQVEAIYESPTPGPFWRKLPNAKDVAGFTALRDTVHGWIAAMIEGGDIKRGKVRDEVVREFNNAALETAEIPVVNMQGKQFRLQFKTWGVPRLAFDGKLNLRIDADPFGSGVHAATLYGMIQLFVDNRWHKLAVCSAPECGKFYFKAKKLRIACSPTCKKTLRHKQIYRAVKKIRDREKSPAKKGKR